MKIEVKKKSPSPTHTQSCSCTCARHKDLSSPTSHQDVLEVKCEPVEEVPPQGELGILSVNSLRRSVSQVMDGKSLTGDDEAWDPHISGHDSGMVRDPKNVCRTCSEHSVITVTLQRNLFMQKQKLEISFFILCPFNKLFSSPLQFMDDEEFVDTIKGFSTVRKEHTMFTDTNL